MFTSDGFIPARIPECALEAITQCVDAIIFNNDILLPIPHWQSLPDDI